MTVFANGLEIACKAQSNQVIAAFPYVCMTPPQTPATPPGVPVPYPTFGMDGDTDKGTSTAKIGGETVTQKNLSYYTKCTGNEAGCAPMKNVISHVNTGKEYAHAWSGNVKMDGEPVSRFSDLSSNDHASPTAGGPPWAKIGKFTPNKLDCKTILADFKVHRHGDKGSGDDKVCPDGYESEHFVQNEYLQWGRENDVTATQFEHYSVDDAPCICMEAYNDSGGPNPKIGSPHHQKTLACNTAIKKKTSTPTLSESIDDCTKAVVDNDPKTKNATKKKKEDVMECLRAVFMEYLDRAVKKKNKKNSAKKAVEAPIAWEVDSRSGRMWARE